jgi:hypothetical protein
VMMFECLVMVELAELTSFREDMFEDELDAAARKS